jgi:hypothetical protein
MRATMDTPTVRKSKPPRPHQPQEKQPISIYFELSVRNTTRGDACSLQGEPPTSYDLYSLGASISNKQPLLGRAHAGATGYSGRHTLLLPSLSRAKMTKP